MTFVIGAALAAVAGTMYLMHYGVVTFSSASFPASRLSLLPFSAVSDRCQAP